MDLFLIQVAILFIPGIIWARLETNFGRRTKPSHTEFLILVLMYGVIIYGIVYLFYEILNYDFSPVYTRSEPEAPIHLKKFVDEILVSVPLAAILGLIWLYIGNYKLLARFLQNIKSTKTYGDEDVWDFTFTSGSRTVEYIYFRDIENGLTLSGWVNSFSESGQLRELLLTDVEVWDLERGCYLYTMPALYIARPRDNILIEFPET